MSEYSIIIEVKDDGNNGTSSGTRSGQGSNGGGTATVRKGSTTEAGSFVMGPSGSVFKQLKKAVAVTGAVAMGTKVLNYKTSRVFTETGNRQWQDNINAAKQVGGQIAGIIGGFVAGGAIGGMVAIGGVALDYALKYESYNFAKQMESTMLSIKQQRMGVGGMAISRSRAGNQ
ncbi:MAG: hypothetical protein OSJ74_00085 [Clostridia bacterium]|nr:hypothetical protein [Clostridia bacterium]